jgi:hypothetical protein
MATCMSAEERRGRWTSLAIGLVIPATLLLVAVAGSNVLLSSHVQFVLVLSLLTALGLIDQALKSLPLKEMRLAAGLALSAAAALMIFCH